MKQKLRKTAALLLTMLMCVCLIPADVLADSSATQTVGVDVTYGQTDARTMFAMINDFRTGKDAWAWNSDNTEKVSYTGLSKLTYDYELEKIAMQRAAEIAVSYSHTRPNGRSCFTLYNSYYTCGENIAAGYNAYTTAAEVFKGWQETDKDYAGQGHRRNMLNSWFTAVGIGHVYYNGCHYWVQEFRAPASGMQATKANDSLTRVNVELLMSDTSVSVSGVPETLSVTCGKTTTLPQLDIRVKMSNTWPYFNTSKVYADYEWTAADSQYVSVSGNTVKGIKAGTTTLTTTVLGKTVSVPVKIVKPPVNLSGFTMTLSKISYTYDGTGKTPAVTVKNGSAALVKGTDYTVTYSNNVNAGTAKVKVTGKGKYTGTIEKTFKINKAEQKLTAGISAGAIKTGKTAAITAKGIGAISYTSDKPEVASVNSKGVVTGKKAGKVNITVTAAGNSNYKAASRTITVTVSLATPVISSVTNTASGVTVKWNKVTGASGYYVYRKTATGSWSRIKTVTGGSTVSYTDTAVKSKNGSTYLYTVRAYSGSYTSSIMSGKKIIRLTTPSITGISNSSSKSMTVKWSKNSSVSGYQVKYVTGTSTKTVTVKGSSTVSKAISGLTKGKTYKVYVRSYKTVSGVTYYSGWSSAKSVKITK